MWLRALPGPKDLGFKTGPLCPKFYTRLKEPYSFNKAPDGTQGLYFGLLNRLTPNDLYSGRTAPLTSKRCILYIYSINIGTEYFKHGIYSPFFSLRNAVCFIILTYLVPVLFTFYIQSVLEFNPLAPNDHYSGRTAPLISKRCILYIYSTNTDTEYFKYGIYSPFFPLQNAVCFINLTYLVPLLFTFYRQVC